MTRLIVEAVSNERKPSSRPGGLDILVSVSKADDGSSITGLHKGNFKITNLGIEKNSNLPDDYTLTCSERTWDPQDSAPAGVYDIRVSFADNGIADLFDFKDGQVFAFGIKVERILFASLKPGQQPSIHEAGQTVVSVIAKSDF